MKPLLAVLLPVKGSYVGYATAGRRSVRGNSKSALLGTVCGVSGFIPTFIRRTWYKRAYNVQWISERIVLDRSENTARTSTQLRAESQLNYAKPLTIYDSAKKPISQTNGRISRTTDCASSKFVSTSSSERAETEIDGGPQAKLQVRST